LPAESNQDLGLEEGEEAWFSGGDHDENEGLTHADMNFDIEPMSMRRVSEAEMMQRAQLTMQGAMQIGQIIMQFPFVDARPLAETYGDAFNIPGFAEFFDYDLGAQFASQMMMQEAVGQEDPQVDVGPDAAAPPSMGLTKTTGAQMPTMPSSTQGAGMGGSAGQQANTAVTPGAV